MIKVSVSGQIFQASSIVYKTDCSSDDWTLSITDIRSIGRSLIKNNTEDPYMYVLWHNDYGYYFAYAIKNKNDHRDGWVMFALCTGEKIPKSGDKIITCLKEISDYFLSKDSDDEEKSKAGRLLVNSTEIEKIVSNSFSCDDMVTTYKLPQVHRSIENNPTHTEDAFRLYDSKEELCKLLQFPSQTEYLDYKKIYLINKDDALDYINENISQNGIKTIDIGGVSSIDNIGSPIKKIYTLDIPSRVKVCLGSKYLQSGDKVMDGDLIKVIYQKEGYKDFEKVNLRVGTLCDYFYHDGLTLVVKQGKDSEGMGIIFKKQFSLDIRDAETGEELLPKVPNVYNSYANISKEPYTLKEPKEYSIFWKNTNITSPEKTYDVQEGMKKTLKIDALGYESETIEVICDKIKQGERIPIKLHAKISEVSIVAQYRKQKDQDYVTIKSNTELYNILKTAENKGYFIYKSNVFSFRALLPNMIYGLVMFSIGLILSWLFIVPWINGKNAKIQKQETEDISYLIKNNEWNSKQIKSHKYNKFYRQVIKADKHAFENYNEIQKNEEWKKICDEYKQLKNGDNKKIKKFKTEIKKKNNGNSFKLVEGNNTIESVPKIEETTETIVSTIAPSSNTRKREIPAKNETETIEKKRPNLD